MPALSEPMYGWALDARGRPIPIGAAKRGAHGYYCPICNSPMIAKKGDVKQHHFAHEELIHCSPDAVAMAIGGRWLVLAMGEAMVLQHPIMVNWHIADQPYQTNILEDVVAIVENMPTDHGKADIALKTRSGDIKAVITLREPPDQLQVGRFAAAGIPVLLPDVQKFRSGQVSVETLLGTAAVRGGWQLVGPATAGAVITDPEEIRTLLRQSVDKAPHHFWGALQEVPPHHHVLKIGDKQLWLPPEVWRTTIGGSLNHLSELDVIIKDWPAEDDGSVIWLFYVMLRNTSAVAVRRFSSPTEAHASLTFAYQLRRTTAEQVAHLLATS